MKKLSTLIAIALIVTIGSVYAAWSYSQGTTASVDVSREINMAQVVTTGNKGTISATPQNNFAFLVDDIADDDGNGNDTKYKAALVGTGDIKINFTANPGADQTTATQGIKMIATVTLKKTTADGLKYDDPSTEAVEAIVPIKVKEEGGVLKNVITLENGELTREADITAAQIVGCLEIANVILDTKAENDAFHTALKDYTIVITISETK